MKEIIEELRKHFSTWAGEPCLDVTPLPLSGSERHFWRLSGRSVSAIGVYHPVMEENRAFYEFTRHFLKSGLNVPQIYHHHPEKGIFLLEDLGDTTLFSLVKRDPENSFGPEIIAYYKLALLELVKFQVLAGKGLDYHLCYPRASFDRQSIAWDLNYFKYDFLKLEASFNEQKLEDDFHRLADFLLQAPSDFFMYRDFQSRNIMVHKDKLYFLDYQGGRKGPLHYDPVSLLFQVKADMPFDLREDLLRHYLSSLKNYLEIDEAHFYHYYQGFILLRLLQVLGAYGFRGLIQKKLHFSSSLPYAMKNIGWLLERWQLPVPLPELRRCLEQISGSGKFDFPEKKLHHKLVVSVRSFSYKKGIPEDFEGHGGGFVFDCRALPNPGREESMKMLTGKDEVVSKYLAGSDEVEKYLDHVFQVVDQSVENYLMRGFDRLSASFGCTGGQHRSVFCAERLSEHLQNKFPDIVVRLNHRELDSK